MSLWNKILLLKKGLQLCIALNVLCIVTGGVIGTDHWLNKQKIVEQSHLIFNDLHDIENIRIQIQSLKDQTPLNKHSPSYEAKLFKAWQTWTLLNTEITSLEDRNILPISKFTFDTAKGPSPEILGALLTTLSNQHQRSLTKLKVMQAKVSSFHVQLITVAILTFLFGILLPGFLFALVTKLLNQARRELQIQIKTWVDAWAGLSGKNEPFKDPQFWINISLLGVELFSQNSSHPMATVSGDISKLVRTELNKAYNRDKKDKNTYAA